MLNKGLELNFSEEGQLITLYGQKQPTKALELLIASWERTGDPRRLIDAIQLAEQLQQWQQLSLLVKDAEQQPGLAARLPVILAQGLLAERRWEWTKEWLEYEEPEEGVGPEGPMLIFGIDASALETACAPHAYVCTFSVCACRSSDLEHVASGTDSVHS